MRQAGEPRGVIGMGRAGTAVAESARGLGMTVIRGEPLRHRVA